MKKILLSALVTLLISNIGYSQSNKSNFTTESSKVSTADFPLEVKNTNPLHRNELASYSFGNSEIPLIGLVGYYQLNDGTYIDSSTSGFDLEEVGVGGSLLPVEDRFGENDKALDFNNEYLDLGTNTNAFNFSSDSNLSLCVWLNLQEPVSSWKGIVNNWNFGDGYFLGVNPNQGIRWNVGGPNPIDSPQPILLNEWTHVAVTYNGITSAIYINGGLVQTGVNNTPIVASSLSFSVGCQANQPTYLFPGVMDDILVYDRVLTGSEITDIFSTIVEENVINPISATTTLSAQFGSSLDNAINGAGLDEFPSLSATHEATNPANSFLATNEVGSIDFDLGGSYLVDGLAFWNINAPGPGGTGIQGVMVSSSEDGVTYTPIDGSPTAFTQVMTPTSPSETFTFTAVTASYIRFDVLSNHGDPGNLIAFAEVAFSGTSLLSISENALSSVISLYPNPASDVITINNASNAELKEINVYDINGRLVKQLRVKSITTSNHTLDVSPLSSGIYMVHIIGNKSNTVKRLIKL
ncbi:MAG: hypothetical protein ACI840_000162 [Ulvibacter sp.]|jgi:hypothetical protein